MSRPDLTILWRGPLESCNYDCPYCPFAKVEEGKVALAKDEAALARFEGWVGAWRRGTLAVFFTPWGEALVRPWYREALARLSRLPHVTRVAVQTNLSCRLDWLERADPARLALWCTFHPGQVERARFVERVLEARARGFRLSVGVVGLKEHLDQVEALRRELPPDVYVWVNAYKRLRSASGAASGDPVVAPRPPSSTRRERASQASGRRGVPLPAPPPYYTPDERARLEAVDPLFPLNAVDHPSRGLPCRAGSAVISVDGDGEVRRCHFVDARLGNIYAPGFEAALVPRPCPNRTCGCHIGYVHLEPLGLEATFAGGLLERIPAGWNSAGSSRHDPRDGPAAPRGVDQRS